jgi:Fe2+ or Zn2+ uptake regulation protein
MDVDALIRKHGLRLTAQRRAILEYLQASHEHPTADQVLAEVNRRFPMTSRATVYNTLAWLKESGLVREVFEGGVSRFDPNLDRHHHFVCRGCGRLEDVAWSELPQLPPVRLAGRRKVESYAITLRGLCDRCRRKES